MTLYDKVWSWFWVLLAAVVVGVVIADGQFFHNSFCAGLLFSIGIDHLITLITGRPLARPSKEAAKDDTV